MRRRRNGKAGMKQYGGGKGYETDEHKRSLQRSTFTDDFSLFTDDRTHIEADDYYYDDYYYDDYYYDDDGVLAPESIDTAAPTASWTNAPVASLSNPEPIVLFVKQEVDPPTNEPTLLSSDAPSSTPSLVEEIVFFREDYKAPTHPPVTHAPAISPTHAPTLEEDRECSDAPSSVPSMVPTE